MLDIPNNVAIRKGFIKIPVKVVNRKVNLFIHSLEVCSGITCVDDRIKVNVNYVFILLF